MSKWNFDRVEKNFEQVKRQLPILLATQAERHFTKNFKEQGFDGAKWQEVNRRIVGTNEYKYPKTKGLTRRKKPILIGTGALRRAVSKSKKVATWRLIKLEVSLPYAENHNEGVTLPKRQFMGDSRELRRKQRKLIIKTIDKIWN